MGKEDVAAGKIKQVKGKANDIAAASLKPGNTAQQVKGKVQKAVGKVQEAMGKAWVTPPIALRQEEQRGLIRDFPICDLRLNVFSPITQIANLKSKISSHTPVNVLAQKN